MIAKETKNRYLNNIGWHWQSFLTYIIGHFPIVPPWDTLAATCNMLEFYDEYVRSTSVISLQVWELTIWEFDDF